MTDHVKNPKAIAGKKGGLRTLELHALEFCPTCNRPLLNNFYSEIGNKGGYARLKAIGREGMSELGKRGGRPRIYSKSEEVKNEGSYSQER